MMRWILILFIGLSLTSCDEPKNYAKDYQTRKILDSLFKKQSFEINENLTTQCSIRVETKLDGMVDSILTVRRKEVEDILRREILENAK